MISSKLARRSLAPLSLIVCTANAGCSWLLSGGERSQPRTAPVEIANRSNATVCSVKMWSDTGGVTTPDQNVLEAAVQTPMGIEVKVFPIQPGDTRYFRLVAPATYHAKMTPCGGQEQDVPDFKLATRAGYRVVFD